MKPRPLPSSDPLLWLFGSRVKKERHVTPYLELSQKAKRYSKTLVACLVVLVGSISLSSHEVHSGSAGAEQGVSPGELETLKRMMQEVISENQELTKRVRELEAEMTKLKGAMIKQEQVSEEAAKQAAKEPAIKKAFEEARKPAPPEQLAAMINKYVEFGGVIEVQAGWINDFNGVSESDIRLETAEFDFEVRVTDWVTGTLIVEWDSDEDKLTVDEAFITIGDTEIFPLFLNAGRIVVPFGISTGDPVADTLAIEAFETKEV